MTRPSCAPTSLAATRLPLGFVATWSWAVALAPALGVEPDALGSAGLACAAAPSLISACARAAVPCGQPQDDTASGSVRFGDYLPPIAIVRARVITGTGETLDDATVLIVGDRIAAVGSQVAIPPEARRIDGRGLTVYPGFVDAMSRLGVADAPRTEAQRQRVEDDLLDPRESAPAETHAANRRGIQPELRAIDLYTPNLEALEAHRKGGFAAALVVPRTGILGGRSDLFSLSDAPMRRAVLMPDVAMHASFTTGEPGDYPVTLLGVFALLRQTAIDARWQEQMRAFAARHPRTAPRIAEDEALTATLPMLTRRQPVIFEADTEVEIRRAIRLADELQFDVVLSGAREAWKVAPLLRERRIPVIASLKFDEEPEYQRKEKPDERKGTKPAPEEQTTEQAEKEKEKEKSRGEASKEAQRIARFEPLKVRQERRRLWEEQVANVLRLQEAGVRVALRTSDVKDEEEFWSNLHKLCERGLKESSAVDALAVAPAQILSGRPRTGRADLDTQIGTLAPERLANLTIMTGPVSDENSKVRYVFADGKKFEFDVEQPKEAPSKSAESPSPDASKAQAPPGPPAPSPPDATGASPPAAVPPKAAVDATTSPTPSSPPATPVNAAPLIIPDFESEIEADRRPRTRTGGNCVIKDATVIPVTGPVLPKASILVRDGRIAAVGADILMPDGVTVIDGTGRFVIPGVIDPHSHLGIDDTNEAAYSISAEVRVEDVINPTTVGLYRALAGGVTTTHVMHGSANTIGGQCDIVKLKYLRPAGELPMAGAPPTIKFALGENVIQSNFPGAAGKRFPNSRTGVEATVRRAFDEAADYQQALQRYESQTAAGQDVPPVRRDLRLEALSNILRGDLFVHCHCYRSDEILRFMDLMEDYGVRISVLQHVWDGYRIVPEIARHGCGASSFATSWAYKIEANEAVPDNAALLLRGGVCASINSDSPDYIRYLNIEAAKSMRWGRLSADDAIKLCTLNPARQLRIDARVGSIEVGKDADLAIYDGHPLNAFAKCVMTLIDGEAWFEDARVAPADGASEAPEPHVVNAAMPKSAQGVYAIVGATLHVMNAPTIANGAVVIADGRIAAVGPRANVKVPKGACAIDAKGLHVYPGLIDAGTTVGLDEIESIRGTNMSFELGRFEPDVRAISAVYPFNEHVRSTRAVGFTSVLAMPRGAQIAGQSAVVNLDGWTAKDMSLVNEFALHLTLPTLPLHTPEADRKKTRDEYDRQMKELEDFLARASAYAEAVGVETATASPTGQGIGPPAEKAVPRDPRLAAMVPYVRGQRPVVFHASTLPHIVESVEFAQKHGLRCILYGAQESWKIADELAKRQVGVLLIDPTAMPGEFEPWDSVYCCAAALDRAGVRFAFASGAADSSFTMPIDVGLAVAHGLAPQRAEYAMTMGAADILGLGDRLGSIEAGKQADLIVTTGSPLQPSTQAAYVFIRGKPVDLSTRQTQNVETFSRRPTPALPPAPTLRGPASLTAPASPSSSAH